MAREYPRFLFSNPQNTKSKGPFIIHCLEPRLIFKFEKSIGKKGYDLILLEDWSPINYMQSIEPTAVQDLERKSLILKIAKEAKDWYNNQIDTNSHFY